jgi:hypothetical protein
MLVSIEQRSDVEGGLASSKEAADANRGAANQGIGVVERGDQDLAVEQLFLVAPTVERKAQRDGASLRRRSVQRDLSRQRHGLLRFGRDEVGRERERSARLSMRPLVGRIEPVGAKEGRRRVGLELVEIGSDRTRGVRRRLEE